MQIDETALHRHIGEQLKWQRQRRGFTQQQLADAVHMLRTSIANIETGRQKATLYILYKLCLVLDVEVKILLPNVSDVVQVEASHLHDEAPRATEFLKQLSDE